MHRAPAAHLLLQTAERARTLLVPDHHSDAMSPWRRRVGVALWMTELQCMHHCSDAPLAGGGGPVVSMTSYGGRIKTVHLALESVAAGSLTPSRTILWLSESDVTSALPDNLRRLAVRGLEVRPTQDYGPHTKYFPYVMQEAIQEPLVTMDDDVLYPSWWLAGLGEAFARNQNNIHAYRAHVMQLDASGTRFRPYSDWAACRHTRASVRNFATGVSGVLYPPEVLAALRASGHGFAECCQWADDIWLNLHGLKAGYPVAQVRANSMRFSGILLTQSRGLYHRNIYSFGNDAALAATFGPREMFMLDNSMELAAERRAENLEGL